MHPGVNLDRFRPADGRAAARERLGLPQDALIPLFAGRIQPLKAPDMLLRAVALLLDEDPSLRRRLVVPVVGGPSGSGLAKPEGLQKLAAKLGIADLVRFRPPVGQEQLADWYRAASVLVMPSYSESFGLVAAEAQACGTPVVAAAVGGLPVAVRDGVSGYLVAGHDPAEYARALRRFADRRGAGRAAGRRWRPGTRRASAGARPPRRPPTSTPTRCWSARRRLRSPHGLSRAHVTGPGPRRRSIEQALKDAGLEWESPSDGTFVVTLPGTRKLSTTCSLAVGAHSLSVNAFVVRHPDENHAAVHRWLLERNTRMYGVSYAVDRLGDIYLTGRLPLGAVTAEEVDRILGSVLENADGAFNTLLEMGFATAIRREYAWRTSRGESTRNLDAFTHLTERDI